MSNIILIGYSGHAYVVISIFHALGQNVKTYCDKEEKKVNPFKLKFLGSELSSDARIAFSKQNFFISIGNNFVRHQIFQELKKHELFPINAIHPSAVISANMQMGTSGIMVAPGVCINPLSIISNGAICNTGCIIEHECQIGDFAHIGPGTVLCGNVHVGENSFVGAKSVVREGIKIGKNVIIGAGSVVVKDIPDNAKVAGNPARPLP